MKKITLLSTALFLSFASFAQSELAMNNTKDKTPGTSIEMSKTDGVMMKNGTMMTVKKGETTKMTSDFTCKDGTKVTTNGTVTKKDGSQKMLKEGEYMDACGKVMPVSNSKTATEKNNQRAKDKNIYLVPDSTVKHK